MWYGNPHNEQHRPHHAATDYSFIGGFIYKSRKLEPSLSPCTYSHSLSVRGHLVSFDRWTLKKINIICNKVIGINA